MSEPRLEEIVPGDLAGLRLDQALAKMFPQYSRSRLKAWILDGSITVDGANLKPRDAIEGGEEIVITPPEETETQSEAQPMTLEVAYEDESLIIIDKPAGLVVHPGAGNVSGTLLNGLLHRYPELASLPRAGIVHRLDKDTTGLLLVARSLTVHTALVRQLADRAITRRYDAICVGVLTAGGTIDAPIGRHPIDRVRMAVHDKGKPAVTHYRVVRRYAAHTWVKVSLETGRTHQIRVHFAWKRHPLVGDPVYGKRLALPPGASPPLIAALRGFRRQALCATHLELEHPTSGRRIVVSTDPARDFEMLTKALEDDLEARNS